MTDYFNAFFLDGEKNRVKLTLLGKETTVTHICQDRIHVFLVV